MAPDATTADAVATALNVLSPAEGMRLVESQPEWAASGTYRTDGGLRRVVSSRMKALLSRGDAPAAR